MLTLHCGTPPLCTWSLPAPSVSGPRSPSIFHTPTQLSLWQADGGPEWSTLVTGSDVNRFLSYLVLA